jgi:aspartate/methionine/tyrosine aminotransferase
MTADPTGGPGGDGGIAEYTIQRWLFDTAVGRYDIDLAESGVQFQRFGDVPADPGWELDYSLDRGAAPTREAVAALYDGLDPRRVVIAHGAQESLYLLYRSLLRPGDHVVATTPGWQQAWEVPRHIGCAVTTLHWEPGTAFDPDALAAALRPDTRLLILNSPGNPSGCALDEAAWAAIVALAERHGLWIVNDEEYLLDFGASVVHRYDRAVSVSSLSKVYGLPALRFGWAAGPAALIEAMVNYKRYTTVSNSLLAERIGAAVLRDRAAQLLRYDTLVSGGRERLLAFADEHRERLGLVPPQGTPFAWFRLHTDGTSDAFAQRLLAGHGVLVMPAEVFGAEHGLRISYARPAALLDEGLNRIGKALTQESTP